MSFKMRSSRTWASAWSQAPVRVLGMAGGYPILTRKGEPAKPGLGLDGRTGGGSVGQQRGFLARGSFGAPVVKSDILAQDSTSMHAGRPGLSIFPPRRCLRNSPPLDEGQGEAGGWPAAGGQARAPGPHSSTRANLRLQRSRGALGPTLLLQVVLAGFLTLAQPGICSCWMLHHVHPHPFAHSELPHDHGYLFWYYSSSPAQTAPALPGGDEVHARLRNLSNQWSEVSERLPGSPRWSSPPSIPPPRPAG